MVTTQSPLCLEKELRPQDKRIPAKTPRCFPNLCPWLQLFGLALKQRKRWPPFLGSSLRSCSPKRGRTTVSPNTATPRPNGCVRDSRALGAGGGRGEARLRSWPHSRGQFQERAQLPPRQVRKGWAGFASGVPPRASSGHPSLTPVLWILGDRMTTRGTLRPAKPKIKATCHGGEETRLRLPAGPRAGGAWAGAQVLVSVFCSRSLGDRLSTPPRGSAAWRPREGSRDLGQRLSGRPR